MEMEYTYLKESWEREKESGNTDRAIELLREQISTNLMLVHNIFSDNQLSSSDDVYAFVVFDNVREENIEKFKCFSSLSDELRELEYGVLWNVPQEEILKQYELLEENLKIAIKNI